MCDSCSGRVDTVFSNLALNQEFRTPDNRRGVTFSIQQIGNNQDVIKITPQNINISRAAFLAALHYLHEYQRNHGVNTPRPISSNNDQEKAGALCVAARNQNGNTRCINYILPILGVNDLVSIDGSRRPNITWLNQTA